MTTAPNRLPTFIKEGGIIGTPVSISGTGTVCQRDAPGNVPLVLYDNQAEYASGNGAIVENVVIAPTGAVADSTLFFFVKIDEGAWLYYAEVDLAALASQSATAKPASYPLRADLGRQIYSPVAMVGSNPGIPAFRINPNTRPYQLGCAVGTNIGALPMIVWLEGGEL